MTNIIRFIANENPSAARHIKTIIEAAILPVAEHPYLFRPGRVSGTREIVDHPNYLVIYRIDAAGITLFGVLHARQAYPVIDEINSR